MTINGTGGESGPAIGLVLGAGGFVGGAWMMGALLALRECTGWDPGAAEVLVGTSAGAFLAALLGAGRTPAEMVEILSPPAAPGEPSHFGLRLRRAIPVPLPASPRLALATLRRGRDGGPLARLAAWMPNGLLCTGPIAEMIRAQVPEGWAAHSRTWINAYDLGMGERVVFGRRDGPAVDLADAVAASCAIPGVYRPVEIGGRRYVDGGVHSPSNLDVLERAQLDAVICLNPTSSLELGAPGLRNWVGDRLRRLSGSYLGREARRLRARNMEVLLLQPGARDHRAMGLNLMRSDGLDEVVRTAQASVGASLQALRRGTGAPAISRALFGRARSRGERVPARRVAATPARPAGRQALAG